MRDLSRKLQARIAMIVASEARKASDEAKIQIRRILRRNKNTKAIHVGICFRTDVTAHNQRGRRVMRLIEACALGQVGRPPKE
ncbi:MAG: hypothetical protein WCW14_00250 [Candidatus Paceibacterota bacterium]|jgi:hypothetical protein